MTRDDIDKLIKQVQAGKATPASCLQRFVEAATVDQLRGLSAKVLDQMESAVQAGRRKEIDGGLIFRLQSLPRERSAGRITEYIREQYPDTADQWLLAMLGILTHVMADGGTRKETEREAS